MAAIKVNKDNFEQEVINSDKPVLVDFWADWCGPCKMLMPIIEEIADEVTDVKICKLNVDDDQDLAIKYRVMNIPTLKLFKNGEVANTLIGAHPKQEILDMIRG